jgi:TonB family protein
VVFPVWVNNLIAYTLQIGILAAAGTVLAYLFRLRLPRVALLYWQSLLLACLCVFALQEWQHPISYSATTQSEILALSVPAKAGLAAADTGFHIDPGWIGWILTAGGAVRLLWLALGFLRLRSFRRAARTILLEPSLIEEVQLRTGVQATIRFSDSVDTPVTFGIHRPAVILPSRFVELDEGSRMAVLCHELLHIRRRDWLFIIAEEIVRSLFWFHPAIWWLLGRIRLSREQAVDYEVVRLTGNLQPYLESLLEFARAQGRPRAVPAPLFLKERHLVQRIALLIKEVSMSRSRVLISLAGISILLMVTVRLAAGWFPLTGEPVIVREQTPPLMPSATAHNDGAAKIGAVSPAPRNSVVAAKARKVMVAENVAPGLPAEPPVTAQEPAAPFRDPIRVGGNVQESKLIYKVDPVYPELAKRARVTGRVILLVTANEEGTVSDVKVQSGHPLLDEAAITAVRQWRYSPTLLNGVPVPVIFTVTCVFNFMGENDVPIAMDESGNLSVLGQPADLESQIPKLVQGGTAFIQIAANTPIQIAEGVLLDLQKRGVQRIQLSGPFAMYQGKLFYTRAPATPPRLMPDISRLQALLNTSSAQSETGTVDMFHFSIYVNEFSEIVGVQRIVGPDNPEIERELMRTKVISPAMLGVNPVPFMYSLRVAPGPWPR